jgi:hypothetical protein
LRSVLFSSSAQREKKMTYGIKKTPLLKRERGFLLGGKRNCSIMGIFTNARYGGKGSNRRGL